MIELHKPRPFSVSRMKDHPRNYRDHPEDQIEHLMASMEQAGFYRNVVIARDHTILAGHGVVTAARRLDMDKVLAVKMDLDPGDPLALKILAADNYLSEFSIDDDRTLTELLRDIQEEDSLLGTGFDDLSLAALVMVTRTAAEIESFDAAKEWVGMPDFETAPDDHSSSFRLIVHCQSEEAREEAVKKLDLYVRQQTRQWTGWYPRKERQDVVSIAWKEQE